MLTKKAFLIAAASLLATATLVAATSVNTGKKPAGTKAVKTKVAPEKGAVCNRQRTHCFD